MASISSDANGNRTIQFVDPIDQKRKSIRLGKCSMKQADEAKIKIEHLVSCRASGCSPDPVYIAWAASLGDVIHKRLSAAGLVRERASATLGAFLDALIGSRTDLAKGTRTNLAVSKTRIVRFFGAEKNLRDVNEGDADAFAIWLKTQEYATATVARTLKHAREFWKAAMRRKLTSENPFLSVKIPSMVNKTRSFFVTREMTAAILDSCPDREWRLLFLLCRIGGLRCPSEPLSLRLTDVLWDKDRIRIFSPKLKGDEDGGERFIPIFPELRPLLMEAFEQAEVGQEFLITRYRDTNINLRTQLMRIIRRAGLKPWPRLFQNLRASRETELAAEYPLHVVCQWIGNSARVANSHYLQVTCQDFERASASGAESGAVALQKAVQHEAAQVSKSEQQKQKAQENPGPLLAVASTYLPRYKDVVTLTGCELNSVTPISDSTLRQSDFLSGAESGAFDPELREIVEAWPMLNEDIRAAILSIARSNAVQSSP